MTKNQALDERGTLELTDTKDIDFSVLDSQGWNVLHAACTGGNLELVEYLI